VNVDVRFEKPQLAKRAYYMLDHAVDQRCRRITRSRGSAVHGVFVDFFAIPPTLEPPSSVLNPLQLSSKRRSEIARKAAAARWAKAKKT